LNCDSGKGIEAEELSRVAVESFRADAYTDEESLAQSMLSRALLQQGKLNEARSPIAEAVRLSQKSQDVFVRIPVILDHAYFMAADGNLVGAETSAQDALRQARNLNLFRLQLEASLALGEIQMRKKNRDIGRKRLVETEKNAHAKGFELIAQKATAAQAVMTKVWRGPVSDPSRLYVFRRLPPIALGAGRSYSSTHASS
jgi:tetratricopeptide (TPR) repeat protein